jgi:hypothetical protein
MLHHERAADLNLCHLCQTCANRLVSTLLLYLVLYCVCYCTPPVWVLPMGPVPRLALYLHNVRHLSYYVMGPARALPLRLYHQTLPVVKHRRTQTVCVQGVRLSLIMQVRRVVHSLMSRLRSLLTSSDRFRQFDTASTPFPALQWLQIQGAGAAQRFSYLAVVYVQGTNHRKVGQVTKKKDACYDLRFLYTLRGCY